MAQEVHEIGPAAVVARIRDTVGDAPVYLSFDIDVLDPAFAPGTGTPGNRRARRHWQVQAILPAVHQLPVRRHGRGRGGARPMTSPRSPRSPARRWRGNISVCRASARSARPGLHGASSGLHSIGRTCPQGENTSSSTEGSLWLHRYGLSRRQALFLGRGACGSGVGPRGVGAGRQADRQVCARARRRDFHLRADLRAGHGFGGGGNTEGPVWWRDGGYLLFSSIGENRRIRYTPGKGTSVDKENTNGANGLTRDPQGRLVICEGLTRRVTREEHDGSITVVAATSRAISSTSRTTWW